MPRNDQITRPWHLSRWLESSNGLTLQQLVDSVPECFPKTRRTVRLELQTLKAAGLPLATNRHTGQTRWRLMNEFWHIPAHGYGQPNLRWCGWAAQAWINATTAGRLRGSQENPWFLRLKSSKNSDALWEKTNIWS